MKKDDCLAFAGDCHAQCQAICGLHFTMFDFRHDIASEVLASISLRRCRVDGDRLFVAWAKPLKPSLTREEPSSEGLRDVIEQQL
jgi:hypothetical protein